MSSEVVRRSSGDVDHPRSRSTDDASWGTGGSSPLTWHDLPAVSRAHDHGYGDLMSEAVRDYSAFTIDINGYPHQTRVGWRAYSDRIVFVRAARPVPPTAREGSDPSAAWFHLEGHVFFAKRPPVRTRGVLAAEVASSVDGRGGSTDPESRPNSEHESSVKTMSYLPSRVQSTVSRAVPDPTLSVASLVRGDRLGHPFEHFLRALRVNATAAVAVDAYRSMAPGATSLSTQPWQVTQWVFELGDPATPVEGSSGPLMLGGGR